MIRAFLDKVLLNARSYLNLNKGMKMNWNDTDYRAWVCEQLGVDYDGLPLSHSLKQRFLAMAQKAALVYPGPLARRNVNLLMTKPAAPVLDTAEPRVAGRPFFGTRPSSTQAPSHHQALDAPLMVAWM